MKRREFLTLLGGAAAGRPIAAQTHPVSGVKRIGILMGYRENDPQGHSRLEIFVQSLKGLGWADNGNLRIDYRWCGDDADLIQRFAKELVELKPDVIMTTFTAVTAAVQRQTALIPIVFALVSDPVGDRIVNSLAQPGSNLTGFINQEAPIAGKWLEVLKEIDPRVKTAAIMFNPATASQNGAYFLSPFQVAAKALTIKPLAVPVQSESDIETAMLMISREPGAGVAMMADSFMTVHRAKFIALAAQHQVAAVYPSRVFPTEGGLISYGPEYLDIFRRVALYVDRILRGAKANDLPVQAPTKFELVINVKTAKALGLAVPPTLLTRADEVIE
jgi:putative ABC transport system substrate-binding protein